MVWAISMFTSRLIRVNSLRILRASWIGIISFHPHIKLNGPDRIRSVQPIKISIALFRETQEPIPLLLLMIKAAQIPQKLMSIIVIRSPILKLRELIHYCAMEIVTPRFMLG